MKFVGHFPPSGLALTGGYSTFFFNLLPPRPPSRGNLSKVKCPEINAGQIPSWKMFKGNVRPLQVEKPTAYLLSSMQFVSAEDVKTYRQVVKALTMVKWVEKTFTKLARLSPLRLIVGEAMLF